MKRINLLWPVLLMLYISACKPKPPVGPVVTEKSSGEIILEKNTAARTDFDAIEFRGSADVSAGEDGGSFTYRIRIKKDEMLWASVSKFGFEGARVLCTTDSVHVRNYMQNKGMHCDLSFLARKAGIAPDFGTLQNLLLGEITFPPDSGLTFMDGEGPGHRFGGVMENYRLTYVLDTVNYKVTELLAEDPRGSGSSKVTYGDFREVEGKLIPFSVEVGAETQKPVSAVLKHSKVSFDVDEKDFRFRIPDNYEISNCE